ncbi:MAG: hypothetical protein GPOALKHO_001165 [Sodalis sp.]|uniref:hypothetical protein n=1 Tax=Sodalis sp. (in: enterobacteria) TaxID=1898979 RepID=UPI003872DA47|nr:MAG: hypothetical protein GPOALKHO_001165 [Sodalis sp.]
MAPLCHQPTRLELRLRRVVDTYHIAAIDAVSHQMCSRARARRRWGFSLGRSAIVILATLAIALAASTFQDNMGGCIPMVN